jgi:hypothetical protein
MEPMRGVGIPTFARPVAGAKRSERKGKERKGHAGGDAAEQSHQIGGKDVLRGFPP